MTFKLKNKKYGENYFIFLIFKLFLTCFKLSFLNIYLTLSKVKNRLLNPPKQALNITFTANLVAFTVAALIYRLTSFVPSQ